MVSRRNAWTLSEVELLIEKYDLPIQDLVKLFPRHSQSSIERKMTRLRKEGRIGLKSKETIKAAYRKRHQYDKE
jgi:hypothetical protein